MLNPPQDDEPQGSRDRRVVAASVLGAVVIAAVAVVVIVVTGNGADTPPAAAPPSSSAAAATATASTTTTAAAGTTAAVETVDCPYPAGGAAARPVRPPPAQAAATGAVTGELTTSVGLIGYTLDRAQAPCTVASLVSLASQSFFDDVPCSKLTTATTFLLQCGDPTGTGTGGPGYTVPDELPTTVVAGGTSYPRGTMAMANAGTPDSGGSQFFLVYQDSLLPPTYTVFGTLTESGLSTLDAIAAKGTADGSTDGPPATPVTILALSGS